MTQDLVKKNWWNLLVLQSQRSQAPGQRPSNLCPGIPVWKPTAAHLTRAHLLLRHVAAPFLLSMDPSNPNSSPLIFPSSAFFLLQSQHPVPFPTLRILNSCQSNLQSKGLSWEHSPVFCYFRLQELSIWNLYFGVCEGLTSEMTLSEGPSLAHPCPHGCYLKAFQNSLEKMKKRNWRNLQKSQHWNAMK